MNAKIEVYDHAPSDLRGHESLSPLSVTIRRDGSIHLLHDDQRDGEAITLLPSEWEWAIVRIEQLRAASKRAIEALTSE